MATVSSNSFFDDDSLSILLKKSEESGWSDPLKRKLNGSWLNFWRKENFYEIEIRFGKLGMNGNFIPNFEKKTFYEMINTYSSNPKWSQSNWIHQTDMLMNRNVRFRNEGVSPIWTSETKILLEAVDTQLKNNNYDLRASFSAEITRSSSDGLICEGYRFKNRKTFIFGPIKLDFSVVKTMLNNPPPNFKPEPSFEVEFELLKDYQNKDNSKTITKDFISEIEQFIVELNKVEKPLGAYEKLKKSIPENRTLPTPPTQKGQKRKTTSANKTFNIENPPPKTQKKKLVPTAPSQPPPTINPIFETSKTTPNVINSIRDEFSKPFPSSQTLPTPQIMPAPQTGMQIKHPYLQNFVPSQFSQQTVATNFSFQPSEIGLMPLEKIGIPEYDDSLIPSAMIPKSYSKKKKNEETLKFTAKQPMPTPPKRKLTPKENIFSKSLFDDDKDDKYSPPSDKVAANISFQTTTSQENMIVTNPQNERKIFSLPPIDPF